MGPINVLVMLTAVFVQKAETPPTAVPAPSNQTHSTARGPCDAWYSASAEQTGIQGTTILRVHQLQDGTVQDSAVAQSSGNADLDQAAISCLSTARLRPITQNGAPIDATWERAVVWRHGGPSSVIVPRLPSVPVKCPSPMFFIRGTVSVKVSFEIDTDGVPQDAKVIQSSGDTNLDRVSLQCIVPTFRYSGATQEGKPVSIDWETDVNWKGR